MLAKTPLKPFVTKKAIRNAVEVSNVMSREARRSSTLIKD